VAELQGRWIEEILKLYVRPGWSGALRHVVVYPVLVLLVAAPWSLLPLAAVRGVRRAALRATLSDPWIRLCAAQATWIALVYMFVPGVRGRYLMPMLPFVAVVAARFVRHAEIRPGAWATRLGRMLAGRWALWISASLGLIAIWVGGRDRLPAHPYPLVAASGVIVVTLAALFWMRSRQPPGPVPALLGLAMVYAAVYVGVAETGRDARYTRLAEIGREFAQLVPEEAAVVCDCHDSAGRKVAFALMQGLRRPLASRDRTGPHYRVLHTADAPAADARRLHSAEGFTMWLVDP
jgi:hypothetical protein